MSATLTYDRDMALMAMRGRRFEEAVRLFRNLVRVEPSAANWCSLGYATTGMLVSEQSTADEILFCFKKAIEADPHHRQDIETQYASASLKVMTDIAFYCDNCQIREKMQRHNKLMGGLTTGLGLFVGLTEKKSIFSNVVGIAAVAGGAAQIFHANSQINEIRLSYEKAIHLYNSIWSTCGNSLQNPSIQLQNFQREHQKLKATHLSIAGIELHRGSMILTLGILGIPLSPAFGLPAWIMGHADLKKMASNRMDPSGKSLTNVGMVMGMLGCVGWGIFIVFNMLR